MHRLPTIFRLLIAAALLFASAAPAPRHHRAEAYKNVEYRYSKRQNQALVPQDAVVVGRDMGTSVDALPPEPALVAMPPRSTEFAAALLGRSTLSHLVASLHSSRGPPTAA